MVKKSEPDRESYRYALKGHKIPILTLDTRWHSLFQRKGKNAAIRALEKELNSLLKKQGKLSTDNKQMKKLKKNLMQEIVANMESAEEGKGTDLQKKKVEASQKLILDINDKMKDADQSLLDIPYQIEQVNRELMIEGMKSCYEELHENADRVEVLDAEIGKLQEQLRDKILEKRDCETTNERIYRLMHSLVGPGVMELLDREGGLAGKRREVSLQERRAETEALRTMSGEAPKPENKGILKKWKNKKQTETKPETVDGMELSENDPDAPAGTGNRIPKPRRGALHREAAKEHTDSSAAGGLRRGKTAVQQYEEQEKRRANFIRELAAYDREQEAKRIRERKESRERTQVQNEPEQTEASATELAAAREQERRKRKEEWKRRREQKQ